jgi:hypothetical protein
MGQVAAEAVDLKEVVVLSVHLAVVAVAEMGVDQTWTQRID